MLKNIGGLQLLLGAAILISALFSACEKDPLPGTGIQNDSEQFELLEIDTFTIQARSIREDSLRSDNSNFGLFGSFNDPVFGTTQASFVSKFDLPEGSLDLSIVGNLRIDSAFLILNLVDYYGSDDPLNIEVYEMKELIEDSLVYYTNAEFETSGAPVGGISNHFPDFGNSLFVDGVEELPGIKIPLDSSFAAKILSFNEASYADNFSFQCDFNGLLVKNNNPFQAPEEGAVIRISPTSEFSRIELYFTDEFYAEDSLNEHFNLEFPIGAENQVINLIDHDYTRTEVEPKLDDFAAGEDALYLQSGAGVKCEINIPYLASLSELKPTVHKASLVFPVVNESSLYEIHSRLFLSTRDSAQQAQFLPVHLQEDFGGQYNASTLSYEFNVSKYVQGIIDGEFDSQEWILSDEVGYVSFSHNTVRTLLEGTEGAEKIQLKLTLSIPE